mmetsp:Transcript_73799/g.159735  ORF Transcript_73799/g.159735 Transcript_73799/m.159735 type:complete len:218 (+) Transcript_73799:4086-4739(+)
MVLRKRPSRDNNSTPRQIVSLVEDFQLCEANEEVPIHFEHPLNVDSNALPIPHLVKRNLWQHQTGCEGGNLPLRQAAVTGPAADVDVILLGNVVPDQPDDGDTTDPAPKVQEQVCAGSARKSGPHRMDVAVSGQCGHAVPSISHVCRFETRHVVIPVHLDLLDSINGTVFSQPHGPGRGSLRHLNVNVAASEELIYVGEHRDVLSHPGNFHPSGIII